MKKFKNMIDTVIVPGASSVVGEMCALALDKKGFQVFAGVLNQADADMLKEKTVGNLIPVLMDSGDPQSLTSMLTIVSNVVGNSGIIGLVNNMELACGGSIEQIAISTLRRQLEEHVIGQIKITQKFLPLLRLGKGRIINIGSINAELSERFLGPQSAFKYAMDALTDSLREELKPWKISISTIEPCSVFTPVLEKSITTIREYLNGLTPEERLHYKEIFEPFLPLGEKIIKSAVSTEVVVKALIHALVAKRPKTRYLLGADTKVNREWVNPLPDHIRELLIAGITGISKNTSYDYVVASFDTGTIPIRQVS